MTVKILHLSDLHLREGWYEEQGTILASFAKDLKALLANQDPPLLVFSGDFVQAGERPDLFQMFRNKFEPLLEELRIDKTRRVVVPGNHDVSRSDIQNTISVFQAISGQREDESPFNSRIYTEYKDIIFPKFSNYFDFEECIAEYGCGRASFCGSGHDLRSRIGLYTLNTALFSFGGLGGSDGHALEDRGLLRIETRMLNKWLQESKAIYKILVMHHPTSHLIGWAKSELDQIINLSFDLVLQGHVHVPDAHYFHTGLTSTIVLTAPPLFTRKGDILGYALITVNVDERSIEVQYRQTSRALRFVSGSYFSGTDDGKVKFGLAVHPDQQPRPFELPGPSVDRVSYHLRSRFEQASTCHSSLGPLWVTPDIGAVPETSAEPDALVVPATDILKTPTNLIIKAPPLFGLTSLAHFLALEAWSQQPGTLFLVIDADELPNHESGVRDAVERALQATETSVASLSGLILDNALPRNNLHIRKINSIQSAFPSAQLILLCGIDDHEHIGVPIGSDLPGRFEQRYVWTLDRPKIRELVTQYCARGCQLDEDALTSKIVDDLHVLNLYRTPLNCITLMRIADAMFDHSPVNRTEMIERFLFLLFTDFARLPKYETIPDLKDSMYALGFFCEFLLRRDSHAFSKGEFLERMSAYCKDKVIDLDTDILFTCLVSENIFIKRDNMYRFRFAHWILFFAAHRMYHSTDFANYILQSRRYARFPEIIEFYSGIDRRRSHLLEVLRDDLTSLNHGLHHRIRLSADFNPYDLVRWTPSPTDLAQIQKEIEDETAHSGLPTLVKDQLADRTYDRGRPYSQELVNFIEESSLSETLRVMRAAATALRNSDHADPDLKRELLDAVIATWMVVLRLAILLAPLIARYRAVEFEAVRFILSSKDESRDLLEHLNAILHGLPQSVVSNFEKDLASRRMAPLFYDFARRTSGRVERLMMVICVLRFRPRGWFEFVYKYLLEENKDSFYLADVYKELRHELSVGFISQDERAQIRKLIGVAVARHTKGAKNPNRKLVEAAARAALGGE